MDFVRRVAYISLFFQGTLAALVISFSAWQLNRCPVAPVAKSDGSEYDASCPARALYSTMLTSTLAYFFPSPLNALVESTLIRRQPYEREGDNSPSASPKRKLRRKEEDESLPK